MKGDLFSISVLLCLLAGLLVSGCTSSVGLGGLGSGSSVSADSLGSVTGHVTLDGQLDATEAAYFKDYEISKEFNNGDPNKGQKTWKDIVDTCVFAVGEDGVYFFEITNGEVAALFTSNEPGYIIINSKGERNNFFEFDAYNNEAYWVKSNKELGDLRYDIPSDRWYNMDAKIITDENGNVCVEAIIMDSGLVNALLNLNSDVDINSNAGTLYTTLSDILMPQ